MLYYAQMKYKKRGNMRKNSLKPIISIIILVAVIGGIYLYDYISLKNANNLIDEINMVNQKKAKVLQTFTIKAASFLTLGGMDNGLDNESTKLLANFKANSDKYIQELQKIKDELKTSRAKKYMDNYIERQKLHLEIVSLSGEYLIQNQESLDAGIQDSIKKNEDKIKELEKIRDEMAKEFTKIMKQNVTLD